MVICSGHYTQNEGAMADVRPVLDMSDAEKRAELITLGYESEANSQQDVTRLSAMLGHARQNPRPMYAGLMILTNSKQIIEDIQPLLSNLGISEMYTSSSAPEPSSQEEKILFTRLAVDDAEAKLSLPRISARILKCPRCGAVAHLYHKRTSSDGSCGIEYANHICTDTSCGLHIERYYEGYGSIFD